MRVLHLALAVSNSEPSGTMRHLGWEDEKATEFSIETDCNGIIWEKFAASHQAEEINEIWPNANYHST